MKIATDVTALTGNTPLVELGRIAADVPSRVVAKLEFFNPAHSVKDRIGVAMIDALERDGKLTRGSPGAARPSSNRPPATPASPSPWLRLLAVIAAS